ncbi:hypothetical protein T492DRAFT_1065413 [Pavlovales sp. CCMP2436]|nr:hypothetical protein T492DRAFT_1065413 [Pavlovales sp. CCMP2436]|mmetsp:Transcript_27777/g.69935  ORF Transcript_27777/g.69935 Transcript_27777/m.69935 type:complete len:354 (-) Transcript_27777:54-1115(-)
MSRAYATLGRAEPAGPAPKPPNGTFQLAFAIGQLLCAFLFPAGLPWMIGYRVVPAYWALTYSAGTVICMFLWEIYITFGLAGGQTRSQRTFKDTATTNDRNGVLSRLARALQPDWINWFYQSSFDSGILLHLLMMWCTSLLVPNAAGEYGPNPLEGNPAYATWNLKAFTIMWILGYAQNIPISLLINNGGLSATQLSWQPLAPTLPLSFDPLLPISWLLSRACHGRCKGATFRVQEGWILVTPIWYAMLVHGQFSAPVPLGGFVAVIVVVCGYLIYFANAFPSQPGVPSFERNSGPLPPLGIHGNYWKAGRPGHYGPYVYLAFVFATPLLLAVAVGALSTALAYAVGVLPLSE